MDGFEYDIDRDDNELIDQHGAREWVEAGRLAKEAEPDDPDWPGY